MNHFKNKMTHVLIFIILISFPLAGIAKALLVPISAPEAYFMSQGKKIKLSQFKGQKTILWLFSTWCHTCAAGVKAFSKKKDDFKKYNVTLLALRNHKNGGYKGPEIDDFINHYIPDKTLTKNWVTGETSEQMNKQYNSLHYPDIYFLIDEKSRKKALHLRFI
jgi:alkyl hydroperoxide reductase subunit AhpC